jgi:hypothetical protein
MKAEYMNMVNFVLFSFSLLATKNLQSRFPPHFFFFENLILNSTFWQYFTNKTNTTCDLVQVVISQEKM